MKKTLSILLAIIAILSAFTCAIAEEPYPAVVDEVTALLEDMEFDPNPDYEEYTMVYYEIEDISAELYCTVSRKVVDEATGTYEYYLECNFYGDDQMTTSTYDGTTIEVTADKTGFMAGDTQAILDIAIANNVWFPIEEAAA